MKIDIEHIISGQDNYEIAVFLKAVLLNWLYSVALTACQMINEICPMVLIDCQDNITVTVVLS